MILISILQPKTVRLEEVKMVKKTNILPNHTTNLYPEDKLEKLPPNKDYLYIFKGYGELSAFQALLSQKK